MDKARVIIDFLEERYGGYFRKGPSRNVFRTLIGTILSHRTKDEVSWPASKRLFKRVKSPKEILKLSRKEIERIIYPVGFYREKAKKILKVSKILLEKYDGNVPKTREELLELPGVGYKTADIVLMYGFGKPRIAIDTHCNRVSKRIGLVNKKANVEEIRKKLESLFPKKKWYLINLGFVTFGKEICKPISPLCIKNPNECPFTKFCKAYKFKKFDIRQV